MKSTGVTATFAALFLLSAGAYSQDQDAKSFTAGLSILSLLTDNAQKSEFDELEERQDEVSAYFRGDYENNYLSFLADYNIRYRRFDEDSQEDRRIIEGRADFRLGKEDGFADLLISNDRTGLYDTPDDVPITSNLDERSLWRAKPTVRFKVGRADTLAFSGELATVRYRYNELRDSDRGSANVTWAHRFSEISSLSADVGALEVEYPNGEASNFQNQYANLIYSASLRKLTYSIRAGINRAEFDDTNDSYQEPTYALTARYQSGVHVLGFDASQDITDSSIGSGRLPDSSPDEEYDATGLDQIERQSMSVRWEYGGICSRCIFTLNGKYEADNYRRLNEDGENNQFRAAFDYRLSSRTTAIVNYSYEIHDYEDEARAGYITDRAGFELRHRYTDHVTFRGFYSYESRDVDGSGAEYQESQVGLSASMEI